MEYNAWEYFNAARSSSSRLSRLEEFLEPSQAVAGEYGRRPAFRIRTATAAIEKIRCISRPYGVDLGLAWKKQIVCTCTVPALLSRHRKLQRMRVVGISDEGVIFCHFLHVRSVFKRPAARTLVINHKLNAGFHVIRC